MRVRLPRGAENQLLQVRLGIASSLFTALRARHFDTAAHSLRVTLGCASWALSLDMSPEQRDIIEVAALLHDIGKIGVPDSVLLKPAALTPDEMAVMEQHRRIGVEILRSSCASPAILDIVAWGNAWYDGKPGAQAARAPTFRSAPRMLAIVDAFDAMTTDQVYRAGAVARAGLQRAVPLRRHAVRSGPGEDLRRACTSATRPSCTRQWPAAGWKTWTWTACTASGG